MTFLAVCASSRGILEVCTRSPDTGVPSNAIKVGTELARVSRTPSQWRSRHGRGVFVGRVYTEEFKDQIVALHQRDGRTFGEIATEFGLSATSVAKWVREAERREKPGRRPGTADGSERAADAARLAQLERELAQKTEEVEILGKALAFFARRSER
jgi:transposase